MRPRTIIIARSNIVTFSVVTCHIQISFALVYRLGLTMDGDTMFAVKH